MHLTTLFFPPVLANSDGGLIYAFEQSTAPGKAVLIALMLASVFSWSVMVSKFRLLNSVRKHRGEFIDVFRSNRDPLHLYAGGLAFPGAAAYAVYETAMFIICVWALQLGACPAIGLWDSREGLQRSPLECLRCFRLDAAAHAMDTLFLAAGCRHTCVDKSWTNGSSGPLTLVEDWVAWHQWRRWHGRRPRRVWAAVVAQ